jgi:hypothetical protein
VNWLPAGCSQLSRDLMTCMHDTYVALSPCCLIRIYCGVWVWCALSAAGAFTVCCGVGTFTVVILCSGFLFTERCYRARFGNISLSSLPVCLNFSCSHAFRCMAWPLEGWRSRLCLPLRCAAVTSWLRGVPCLQCHGPLLLRAPCYVSSLSDVHVVGMHL